MQIAAGSAVFVIDKGDDLEVLDFHDRGPGSVRIMAQGRDIKLSPGKVLVLTKKDVNDSREQRSRLKSLSAMPKAIHSAAVSRLLRLISPFRLACYQLCLCENLSKMPLEAIGRLLLRFSRIQRSLVM